MKLRRILAWIIDWNLCGAPALIYSLFLSAIIKTQELQLWHLLTFLFFVLSFPTLFVFRDILFNGRSIAKRIFKLRVIDNSTNELPPKYKLILRNLFFSIYPVEAILLIVTNKSLGDMTTNTTIVKK